MMLIHTNTKNVDNVALVYKFVYTIGDYLSKGHIDILVRDEVEDPILCVPSANYSL